MIRGVKTEPQTDMLRNSEFGNRKCWVEKLGTSIEAKAELMDRKRGYGPSG